MKGFIELTLTNKSKASIRIDEIIAFSDGQVIYARNRDSYSLVSSVEEHYDEIAAKIKEATEEHPKVEVIG